MFLNIQREDNLPYYLTPGQLKKRFNHSGRQIFV